MAHHHNPAPGITGMCIVGTTTGSVLITEAYLVPAGAHVAPVLAAALDALWHKLPAAVDRHGEGRFDFLIRQCIDGSEEMTDVLWHSGMRASTLFATVARRMLKAQQAAGQYHPGAHVQAGSVEAMTVTEVENDGSIEWVPPVPPAQRVLDTLAQVIDGSAWDHVRRDQ